MLGRDGPVSTTGTGKGIRPRRILPGGSLLAPRLSAAALAAPGPVTDPGTAGAHPAEGLFPRRARPTPPGAGALSCAIWAVTAKVSRCATVPTRTLHRGTGSEMVAVAEGVAEAAVPAPGGKVRGRPGRPRWPGGRAVGDGARSARAQRHGGQAGPRRARSGARPWARADGCGRQAGLDYRAVRRDRLASQHTAGAYQPGDAVAGAAAPALALRQERWSA